MIAQGVYYFQLGQVHRNRSHERIIISVQPPEIATRAQASNMGPEQPRALHHRYESKRTRALQPEQALQLLLRTEPPGVVCTGDFSRKDFI
jgi:hypothetical protein